MKDITRSFGLIGALCILFSALALILTGVRGAFFYGELIAGVILVAVYIALHSDAFLSFFGSKKTLEGSHTFLYSLIVFSIIAAVNYISYDMLHKRWDLTEQKVFSLSDQSREILKNLKDNVEIIAFFKDTSRDIKKVKELLQNYKDLSNGKVSFRFADPDREYKLAKEAGAKDGTVYFKCGLMTHLVTDMTEEAFTNALIKVSRVDKPVVYSLVSHGCRKPDDNSPAGISDLKRAIENEGFSFKTIKDLAGGVPKDADMLLVMGPSDPLIEPEVRAIEAFLERGGRAAFLLDPVFKNVRIVKDAGLKETGLEKFLEDRGVLLGKDIIITKYLNPLVGIIPSTELQASDFGKSPIVKKLKGQTVVFKEARSVTRILNNTFTGTVTELVKSPKGASWAEKNLTALIRDKTAVPDGYDLRGPVSVAVAVERPGTPGSQNKEKKIKPKEEYRMVVIGDSDFASNDGIARYASNLDLFLNALDWLAGVEEHISIRPRKIKSSHLLLDAKKANIILYVAVFIIPQLIMIFGLIVWQWRRRK